MKKQLLLCILTAQIIAFHSWSQEPRWAWAKSAVNGSSYGQNIVTAPDGSVYVTGTFTTNSVQFGAYTLNAAGGSVFVVKYDSVGNVLWARAASGNAHPEANGLAIDSAGNIFTAGTYQSAISFENITLNYSGGFDIYLTKYDPQGNLLWARSGNGIGDDFLYDIATDRDGNIYLTGSFGLGPSNGSSTNFSGVILTNANAGTYTGDMFIVKYNSAGTALWGKQAGCSYNDSDGSGVATDAVGNVYVIGSFWGTCITFGNLSLPKTGYEEYGDFFIVKYSSAGVPLWARAAAGWYTDVGFDVTVDKTGNVYATGIFESYNITFDSYTLINVSNPNAGSSYQDDIFIVKYDPSGTIIWARQAGGASMDFGHGITTDTNTNVYMTGRYVSSNFTFNNVNVLGGTSFPNVDIFTLKCDSSGSFLWIKTAGGYAGDGANDIVVSGIDNGYVTGGFNSPVIDFGCFNLTNLISPSSNFFISKFGWVENPVIASLSIALTAGTNPGCIGQVLTFTANPVNAGAAPFYQWKVDGVPVGTNSPTYSTTSLVSGQVVSCVLTANNPCVSSPVVNSNSIIVIINTIPAGPGSISGSSSPCYNTFQTYSVIPVSGATGYSWTLPPGWTGNSITNTIIARVGINNGNISVTANNICGNSSVRTLGVIVIPSPDQPMPITGNASPCIGSSQSYAIPPVIGATNYTWTLPPGWTGSSTTNSIVTTVGSSSGDISVTAENSCYSSVTRTLTVSVNTIPAQPGTISGSVLVNTGESHTYSITAVSGATVYTWTLSGGGLITAGQNTTSVTINWMTAGNYILSVNAKNNCGVSIDQTLNITVSPAIYTPFEIKVFPNPSRGQFYLNVKGAANKAIAVDIFNISGQLIYSSQQKAGSNDYTQLLDLNKVATGVYEVRIFVDRDVFIKSIIKVN